LRQAQPFARLPQPHPELLHIDFHTRLSQKVGLS
jgi:hypothetical protein